MKIKHIITSLSLAIATLASAEIPKEFTVYSSQTAGGRIGSCRALFQVYGEKYNANPVYMIRPSSNGITAYEEMLKDKKFSVYCSGLSENVFNGYLFPERKQLHDTMIMVTPISITPMIFFVGPNSELNTIDDLIKSTKPINVGSQGEAGNLTLNLIIGQRQVNWVPFKSAGEVLAPLLDGSVDVFVSGAGQYSDELIKTTKIKTLGVINPTKTTQGVDLSKRFPKAASIKVYTTINTSNKNDPEDIEELNRRLKTVITDPKFIAAAETLGVVPVWMSVKDSQTATEHMREEYRKLKESVK